MTRSKRKAFWFAQYLHKNLLTFSFPVLHLWAGSQTWTPTHMHTRMRAQIHVSHTCRLSACGKPSPHATGRRHSSAAGAWRFCPDLVSLLCVWGVYTGVSPEAAPELRIWEQGVYLIGGLGNTTESKNKLGRDRDKHCDHGQWGPNPTGRCGREHRTCLRMTPPDAAGRWNVYQLIPFLFWSRASVGRERNQTSVLARVTGKYRTRPGQGTCLVHCPKKASIPALLLPYLILHRISFFPLSFHCPHL